MAITPPESGEERITRQALERPPAERTAFLETACAGDTPLLQRVLALLREKEDAAAASQGTVVDPNAPSQRIEAHLDAQQTDLASAEPQSVPPQALAHHQIAANEERPGAVIGRYRLIEKIGEGGFGAVYVAEQREPVRRRVALKIIKLGMDTRQVVARFEAERQALAMMDHPKIAKVLDGGATDSGRPYFVMELVRGVAITRYCDENNLPTEKRLDLFIQTCQAIQHAHQKGIIHRDIKPSNILVTLHDGQPVPKVIDFGIAKATQGELTDKTVYTQIQQFIGTPAYVSPEQAEMSRLDIDTRSDIYSLGVLLYELIVGKIPFDTKELLRAGLDAMRKAIREQEPVRPSTRLGNLSQEEQTTTAKRRGAQALKLINLVRGDLDLIVMKCLEKDRTLRYETANELGMDVERFLRSEPVVARPPSATYRVQKFVRRNKLTVTAVGALATMLVLGVLVSSWEAVRAWRAEREQFRLREAAQRAQADEAQQRRRAEAEVYVADMHLAQMAGEQNDIGRLQDLLEETAAYPERGFEWYYWQRQAHLDFPTLRGHRDWVVSVAFSPDGQRIVTGSRDRTAKVWDAATGKELLTFHGHDGAVHSVAFSPGGRQIASGSADKTAKVWEAATGKQLLVLQGHNAEIKSVAFSPNGQRIVTGSADKTAKVWDAADGKGLLTLQGHGDSLQSVAFSSDSRRIVTTSVDKTAKVWDATSGNELVSFKAHKEMLNSAAFSPDGQQIVSGADDSTRVWDAASGKELLSLAISSQSVAFSPDGQRFVTVWVTAVVRDALTGKSLLTFVGNGASYIWSVAFSPDGKRIATGREEGTAKVWDADTLTLNGHSAPVRSVAFSPDGQRIVTGGVDQMAKVWRTDTGEDLLTLKGHSAPIRCVAFSPDGQRLVTGSADGTFKVWDAATGTTLLTVPVHSSYVLAVAFSPDGRRILSGSFDGTAEVWDAASGKELLALPGHKSPIQSVAFSPDGQRIVAGMDLGTAEVWEAASGKELLALPGHNGPIQSVAYSSDGQRILTGSLDGTAKVWDAIHGSELLTLKGHRNGVTSVAFSPDSRRVVTGCLDATAKVWELGNGKELLTLKGHSGEVHSAAFSPDGRRIVTGSADQSARVWVAATAQQVAAWQQDQKADTERQQVLRREQTAADEPQRALRANDPGAVKQWLILAPIPIADHSQNGNAEALDQEQIPGEGRLRGRVGDRVHVGVSDLVWSALPQEDYLIDFNHVLGQQNDSCVAYAMSYIRSEGHKTGLMMKVGSDDGSKVYLNGKELCLLTTPRRYVPDEKVVEGVELRAGLNVLVFKVVNQSTSWRGSVRFTDAAGQPVKGISVTLDSGGADQP